MGSQHSRGSFPGFEMMYRGEQLTKQAGEPSSGSIELYVALS